MSISLKDIHFTENTKVYKGTLTGTLYVHNFNRVYKIRVLKDGSLDILMRIVCNYYTTKEMVYLPITSMDELKLELLLKIIE